MRKFLLFISLGLVFFFVPHNLAYATITVVQDPKPACQDSKTLKFVFNAEGNSSFLPDKPYRFAAWGPNDKNMPTIFSERGPTNFNEKKLEFQFNLTGAFATIGQWNYKLWMGKGTADINSFSLLLSDVYQIYPKEACITGLAALGMDRKEFQAGTVANLYLRNANPKSDYLIWFRGERSPLFNGKPIETKFSAIPTVEATHSGITTYKFTIPVNVGDPGTKTICLKHGTTTLGFGLDNCEGFIEISVAADAPKTSPIPVQSNEVGTPTGVLTPERKEPRSPPSPCEQWESEGKEISKNSSFYQYPNPIIFPNAKCIKVTTGLGFGISTDPAGFVKSIMGLLLGVSGGIAVLLIIVSGYKFMASRGNPEALQGAREQLISAIVGLLFIIFSLAILQIIGFDILHIPGFDK